MFILNYRTFDFISSPERSLSIDGKIRFGLFGTGPKVLQKLFPPDSTSPDFLTPAGTTVNTTVLLFRKIDLTLSLSHTHTFTLKWCIVIDWYKVFTYQPSVAVASHIGTENCQP